MKIIKFPKKRECGTCKHFEKCFEESTVMIHGIGVKDREFSKHIPACRDYKEVINED